MFRLFNAVKGLLEYQEEDVAECGMGSWTQREIALDPSFSSVMNPHVWMLEVITFCRDRGLPARAYGTLSFNRRKDLSISKLLIDTIALSLGLVLLQYHMLPGLLDKQRI
jgi:hypothetical protein